METPTTFDPNTIPPIDANGIPPIGGATPATPPPLSKDSLLENAPNDVSLGGFFGKVVMGLVIWGCISALLFAVLSAVGGMLGGETPSAILGILLAFIGFIAGMIGNMWLALLYNLFFSKRYYTLGKMMGLIFTSSIIIFILAIPLYFLVWWGVVMMFTILGFQILFSFFVSSCFIEFLAQPNYAGSSFLGNVLGFVLGVVVYLWVVQGIQGDNNINNQIFLFMLLPTIVGYPVILAGLGIWDAIYYKFFQWGSNPFYLPSLAELRKDRQEEAEKEAKSWEDINVEVS